MEAIISLLSSPAAWGSFFLLTVLEIVLGIDNILVIAIVANRLPKRMRNRARILGLTIAIFTRGLMLAGMSWLTQLTQPIFTVVEHGVSGRDLVLLVGGLFLLWKSVHEVHHTVEHPQLPTLDEEQMIDMPHGKKTPSFGIALVQIVLLDIVFSIDTVVTAVGLANHLPVMIAAIVVAVLAMMTFAGPLADYIHDRPTLTILALAFLMMIGMALVLESMHIEVPKGYMYASMGFAFFVELLHLRFQKNEKILIHKHQTKKHE